MRAVMPPSWFPAPAAPSAGSTTPVLDGLLAGVAAAWSYCYALTGFVAQQTRIRTAGSSFLDIICHDYFGASLMRYPAEADDGFRQRILSNLLMSRATRTDLVNIVADLVGVAPTIFEPFRSADTGGYGGATAPGAGGGGGYGTSGLSLGSSSMAFQYIVSIVLGATRTRRESAATFIDQNGSLQLAPRHALRTIYVDGIATGPLAESRGINLIKDSAGWGGWSRAAGAPVAWQVDSSSSSALWPGQPVLSISVAADGALPGPAVRVTAVGTVTASAWILLPVDHRLQALELVCWTGGPAGTSRGPVDLQILGRWQRVSVTYASGSAIGIDLLVSLAGVSVGAMDLPVLTQCWQVEPGASASSYIPSSGQIGMREADQLITVPVQAAPPVGLDSIDQVIARAIPAASIAWTTVAG